MRDRSDADWEELARKEPYFAVLTDERFLSGSLSPDRLLEFFASGEDDVEHLFDLVAAYLGAPIAPRNALDFGCGAGRLTLALARRAAHVVGVERPGGVIAVHFVFDRRGGVVKHMARRLRASFPLLHRAVQALNREPLRLPYMQMNSYDRGRILALMEEGGCRKPSLTPTDHGGIGGAIVIAVKEPAGGRA